MAVPRNPFADAVFFERYNPNHDPDTGQFTSGDGGGGSGNETEKDLYSEVGSKTGVEDAGQGKGGKGGSGSGGGKGGGNGKSVSGAGSEKPSRPYEGRSPRNDQGVRRLKGATIRRVFAPTDDHDKALRESGTTPITFNELDNSPGSAGVFHTLIGEAKQGNAFGAAVTLYPVEDYQLTRLFVTDDGKVGFALKGDDIVSVFKNPASKDKNVVASILALAVQEGGRRLDCFDTALPDLYSKNDFAVTGRIHWNDEYAPPGWDKKVFTAFNKGEPDVVFMKYQPGAAEYVRGEGKLYDSYDDAMAAQVASVAETKPDRKRAFDPVAEHIRSLFDREERFNPNHDPDTGQFSSGDGGGSGGSVRPTEVAAPAQPDEKGAKVKSKIDDFVKDRVTLGSFSSNKDRAEKFLKDWDDTVGESPGEFKNDFLGGVDATMMLDVQSDGTWRISGELKDGGQIIGNYTREINVRDKTAYSAYFVLNRASRGNDIGKRVLAANVETYKKLGVEKVSVLANIDVGGYAWAKYGYVPTPSDWNKLKGSLARKLDGDSSSRSSSSDGYTPESWDEISETDQEDIRDHWMRDGRDEFIDSEVTSWRDNGNALDDAKSQVASEFEHSDVHAWAQDAIQEWLDERPDDAKSVPYTSAQLINAISLDYANGYEGRGKLDVTFDDDKLREPKGISKEQMSLPGVEPEDLSQRLTPEMRDELETVVSDAFDKQSESVASDLDPPDYLTESAEEYQQQYWDDMDDRDRFRWADRQGYLPNYDLPEDEEEQSELDIEPGSDEASGLAKLVRSNDPKAIWAIADSPQGKGLLLGTDWHGVLNLKDEETMQRFNSYVGKAKAA